MRFFIFSALLIVFLFHESNAQHLQGSVTDAETDEPLIGATVFLPSIQTGTATDENGRFDVALTHPGTYRLVVSFVGYQAESRTVTVEAASVTVDVALRHTTLESPAITITAKAQASDVLSTPQSVAVLDGRDLRLNRGTTAFDALDHTTGVRLLRTGPGIAKPMVRGLTSQRVLVIQNGIRQEGQQWGDEHAPEIDAFGVDRIEVVKGPASLLYGSDALGGVIQATGDDLFAYAEPFSGQVTVQGLSNTRQGAANVRLGGRTGSLFYAGSLTARRAGSFATPDEVIPNTGLEEANGNLQLGRLFSWGRILAEYQHFGSDLGLFEPEEDHEAEEAGDHAGRFDIGQPYQRIGHDRAKLQVNLPVAGNRVAWVTTWQQNRRKEFEEEGHHEHITPAKSGFAAETPEPALFLRLTTVTSDVRFHHRPVGRLFGTIGVSGLYQNNETLAEETLIPDARTWNGGLYLFEELMLPRVTVSGGARLDVRRLAADENDALGIVGQTRSYTALTGALGLAWQPRSGVSLALNAGRAWRAPVLIELFGNGIHEGTIRFERGDATLVPEKSVTLESTVRWLTPHAYVEVSGFVNHIHDYIFPFRTTEIDPASGFFVYDYRQADARLWGGEFKVDLHPHAVEWLHLHVAGDATWTRNRVTDDPLPWSPPARLMADVEVEKERWGAFTEVGLRAGPTFVYEQTHIAPNETPTDGYTLWNASVSGSVQAGALGITPVLAVDNLFDTAYINHLSRFKPFGVLNPGRNVRFEVQLTF